MNIEIDREKAAVYGISIDQVRQELFNAFGTRQVATIYTPDNDYQVILESSRNSRPTPRPVANLSEDQPRQHGQRVPLGGGVLGIRHAERHVDPAQRGHRWSRPSARCRSTTRASSPR